MKRFFLIFVVMFFIGTVSIVYPQIVTDDLWAVNYGNGIYMTGGDNGRILTSTSGEEL